MNTRIAGCVRITILFAALLFNGTKGAGQQPDNEFPRNFVVLDNTGKQVGPVVGVMQGTRITIVAIPFNKKWLPIEVLRSTFQVGGSFYFTSSDCTGQAFLDPSTSPFLATAVFGPTNTLFFESGPSQNITVQSLQDQTTGACSTASLTLAGVPVTPAVDLSVFSPPFRVVTKPN